MSENNNDRLEQKSLYKVLWQMARRLISLNVELARLTIAEKLTLFLVAVVTYVFMLILGAFALAFLSNAAVAALTTALPSWGASLILAGVYICVIAIIYIFRHTLVIKPIARFVSRLIIENNDKISDDDEEKQS